jgi:ankyrin repeat protein
MNIFRASRQGRLDIVKELLNNGVKPDKKYKSKNTALMVASEFGHLDIVAFLLEINKDVKAGINAKNKYGKTALMYASEYGHVKVVDLLLKYNTHIDLKCRNGWTALIYAVLNRQIKVVRVLLEARADPNERNAGCRTALMHASDNGCTKIVRALLKSSADVNLLTAHGDTALTYATRYGHTKVVKLLLLNGAIITLDLLCFVETYHPAILEHRPLYPIKQKYFIKLLNKIFIGRIFLHKGFRKMNSDIIREFIQEFFSKSLTKWF